MTTFNSMGYDLQRIANKVRVQRPLADREGRTEAWSRDLVALDQVQFSRPKKPGEASKPIWLELYRG